MHVSLEGAWWTLEYLPKREKWKEWPDRKSYLGWYIPDAEPRPIPEGAIVHRSVVERMAKIAAYRPINMPTAYAIEEMPPAPVAAGGAAPAPPASTSTSETS